MIKYTSNKSLSITVLAILLLMPKRWRARRFTLDEHQLVKEWSPHNKKTNLMCFLLESFIMLVKFTLKILLQINLHVQINERGQAHSLLSLFGSIPICTSLLFNTRGRALTYWPFPFTLFRCRPNGRYGQRRRICFCLDLHITNLHSSYINATQLDKGKNAWSMNCSMLISFTTIQLLAASKE